MTLVIGLYQETPLRSVSLFFQKQDYNSSACDQTPSWLVKHPIFCSILKQHRDEHVHHVEVFEAGADFRFLVDKVRTSARHEIQRATRASHGAKLLVAATAMRAYRQRFCFVVRHGSQLGVVSIT